MPELKKVNMHRWYRQEALSFYKEIWGIKHAEMNNLQMKKFLHKLKELALSIEDYSSEIFHKNALQVRSPLFINKSKHWPYLLWKKLFAHMTSVCTHDLNALKSCPNLNQTIVTSLCVQRPSESLDNVDKASGLDGVPTYILRELSHELAPILASLFQQSLDQGQLPNDWIKANVVPIFKKGKRFLASN